MCIPFGYTLNHDGGNMLNQQHRMISKALNDCFDNEANGEFSYRVIKRRPGR